MLQFVLGRAGSGKTEYMRRLLADRALAGQGGTVMLVPEQYTFETEKAMLRLAGPVRGNAIPVYSFTRLAEAVFRREGGAVGRRLSDGGRRILMASAIEACQDRLEVYAAAAQSGRVNDVMLTAVNEMKMCGIAPGDLRVAARGLGGRGLGKKLSELALLYDTYNGLVEASYLDSRDDLTRLAQALEGSAFFQGCTVAVDSFEGFTALYEESKDEEEKAGKDLPPLEVGMKLKVRDLKGNQHFTQPPPRYTEASLIKALEENGIGRPSTYAATIATITTREYVTREGKAFKPTELGEVITQLMKERFPKIVNVKFTAQVENELDAVQRGDEDWVDTLQKFYDDFDKTVQKAKKEMDGVKIQLKEDETDVICEKCGRKMVVKFGRYGKFLACPGYPECKNVKKIVNDTGAECPKCGGKIIQRKSKKGRVFYGCSEYPKCDFVSWDPPSKEKCPVCGKTLLQKKSKDKMLYCVTPGCTFPGKKPAQEDEA